jgi:uncharacterized MAPEG superfamily protein
VATQTADGGIAHAIHWLLDQLSVYWMCYKADVGIVHAIYWSLDSLSIHWMYYAGFQGNKGQ